MKRKLLSICLVVVLTVAAICFASCATDNDKTADRLRDISFALLQDYSTVKLTVSAVTDEISLGAEYVMTKSDGLTNISYQVDRLSSFDVNGEIPSDFVTRASGTAVFNGSAIVSVDGDDVDKLILLDVADTTMEFRLSYLSEVKVFDNGIRANVTNPQGFLQNDEFAGKDMTVQVIMAKPYLSRISISYVENGADISLDYAFTKA